MGKEASAGGGSFEAGLLEYPQFTRPREWEGASIPAVLLSGDHAEIAAWRRAEAQRITRRAPARPRRRGGRGTGFEGCVLTRSGAR